MIKIALENLKPQYSEVIKLKYNEHKSQKEISQIFGNSESSIENLLYKARKALKKELLKLRRLDKWR